MIRFGLGVLVGLGLAYLALILMASDDDTITESGGRAYGYLWTLTPDDGPWT